MGHGGFLRRTWFLALGNILLLSGLVACGGGAGQQAETAGPAGGSILTGFAASSLTATPSRTRQQLPTTVYNGKPYPC